MKLQFFKAGSALAMLFAATSAFAGDRCSLDILLTNDDGFDAPGIRAVHLALKSAGHNVTLVGPLHQQSGRGGAMNTHVGSSVAVVEREPGIWSVDGTPTDAVRAGLDVIFADNPPDLVVAGANFGPNLGQEGVHNSGTLGATLAAHYEHLPAIAISTGVDVTEAEAKPPFPSTFEGFRYSGALLANLIDQLSGRHGCDAVLPDGVALNINVPVPVSDIKGIRYAPLALQNLFRMHWDAGDDGSAIITYQQADISKGDPGDDNNLFTRGYVTVTPINGDVTIAAYPTTTGLPAKLKKVLPDPESLE